MLTVTLDWELSGKSKTRNPFSRWYSVMPSTEAIFAGAAANDSSAAMRKMRNEESLMLVIAEIDSVMRMISSLFCDCCTPWQARAKFCEAVSPPRLLGEICSTEKDWSANPACHNRTQRAQKTEGESFNAERQRT